MILVAECCGQAYNAVVFLWIGFPVSVSRGCSQSQQKPFRGSSEYPILGVSFVDTLGCGGHNWGLNYAVRFEFMRKPCRACGVWYPHAKGAVRHLIGRVRNWLRSVRCSGLPCYLRGSG